MLHVIRAEHTDEENNVIGQTIHFLMGEAQTIVQLRNAPDTRDQFSDKDERDLWAIKGAIELVLSSIKVDRETIDLRQVAAE